MSRWPFLVPLLLAVPSAALADDGFEGFSAFPLLGALVALAVFAVTAPIVIVALLPHLEWLAGADELPPVALPAPHASPEATGEGTVTLDASIRRPW